MAVNKGFKLGSIDIRADFLQAKCFDREMYLKPLKDMQMERMIWKLNKPLYRLNRVSRELWLNVKDVHLNLIGKVRRWLRILS